MRVLCAAAALVAAESSAAKVQVLVITEAGCPPCQSAITGSLNDMVNAAGVSDIMELVHHPFGNNYYTTTECGGAPYSATVRHCWAGRCAVQSPAADCFTGAIVPQHGDTEKNVNRMQACAKTLTSTWQAYWPFLECMESQYESQGLNAAQGCAKKASIDMTKLQACYDGTDGDTAQQVEAQATIDHPGTPYVAVNGVEVQDVSTVLQTVCNAYTGVKPSGCSATLI
jgi:hypothetical protein